MEDDFLKPLIQKIQNIQRLSGQNIDPKEIMSPNFNKVFQTKEEAIRDGLVQDYKKGQPVNINNNNIEIFLNDIVDDLIDRL